MTGPVPVNEIGYAHETSGQFWTSLDEEQTPELQWPRSVRVYDAMRSQDSQITSVLRAVALPVRRTPWRIDPAGARDEVVRHVAEDLGLPIVGDSVQVEQPVRTRDRFSWPEHLRLALLMLPFGHSFFEQVYRIDPATGLARLRKLAQRTSKSIADIDVASDGGLVSITQHSVFAIPAKPIPVSRLVAYVHEREGGNWVGRSLLRPAYKNWLIKDRLIRVDAQTIERNGMGIPLYTGADEDDDLSEGRKMASAWRSGNTAGAAIPNGAELRLVGVEGSLPQALPSIRYHDEQAGRAVLAHFLNLGTQTGSWALGSTFADFFTLSLQTLAQQIADTATQHIVEDIVDLNWGVEEPAPRIVFEEIGSRQAATAQAIKMLTDAGILLPDRALEEAARQQFGLPPKDPRPGTTGDGE